MNLPRLGILSLLPLLAAESAPPGATVQLKLFLATPRPSLSATLSVTLDSAFYGDIESVAVFSAAGDASGQANLQGRRATLTFASPTGGIGRVPGLPVAVINVPVLAGVRPGATGAVTATVPALWRDTQGAEFTPQLLPATVTAGGTLSLRAVTPIADILPRDTVLTLEGTGFTAATTAEFDSAAIAETVFISPTQLKIRLAGPATLTGKRLRLRNSNGEAVDHFFAQPITSTIAWIPAGYRPLLPLQVATDWSGLGDFGYVGSDSHAGMLIQNPHPSPVEVTVKGYGLRSLLIGRATRTVQAGESVILDVIGLVPGSFSTQLSAPVPIRAAWIRADADRLPSFTLATPLLPPFARISADASQLNWEWQSGSPAPPSKQLHVCSFGEEFNFSVQAVTVSGGAWLSAPATGRSVRVIQGCFGLGDATSGLDIRIDPTGLKPGVYTGTLTLTPEGDRPVPLTVDVRLTVSDKPFLSSSLAMAHFNFEMGKEPPPPVTLQINSNGAPASFTTETAFAAGPPWLTVKPAGGDTPTSLSLTFNPAGLAIGEYTAVLLIRGPANTLTIPVTASVYGPPGPRPADLNPSPNAARFSWQRGTDVPQPLRISFPPVVLPVSFTVRTDTPGASWFSVYNIDGPGVPGLGIRVDPAALPDGVYRGSVILRSDNPALLVEPVTLPVELTVWSQAPLLTVSPRSVEVDLGPENPTKSVEVTIATGTLAVPVSVMPPPNTGWLRPQLPTPFDTPLLTPAKLLLNINSAGILPGVYTATVRIAAGGQTVDVPVTLRKTGLDLRPYGPPFIGAIVNGASAQAGPVSPGSIITLHGYPLAPADDTRRDIRVLFDGVPAPLLYVSASQINAVVPYEVAGRQTTVVEVEAQPITPNLNSPVFDRSPAQTLPVAASAPALFTLSGSGAGQAAALNQDNALNGPPSPASRGSALQLFATGEGLLSPPQETGAIAESAAARPVLPVRVTIGGIEAQVLYAGPSPGSIFGLVQVNAVVPAVAPGPSVPVVLRIGEAASPEGVTVSIK